MIANSAAVCRLLSAVSNNMQNLAKQNYLQAEVQTATPQKLQLMLVEAAIKNIHRTKKSWDEEKFEAGFDSLSLAQDIVAEILSSLDKDGNPELAGKIASIYVFIFRCIAEAGMTHDQQKLDDALRVLNSERETWKQVCEKFGSAILNPGESSAVGSASSVGSSTRLDLSTDSSAKVAVSPKASGISTSTFAKPIPPKDAAPATTGKSWDV
jgi:flagellar protein FliS